MSGHHNNSQNLTVVGFYGYSNSGKTTLIECVIRDLIHEGYRVAAVKISGQKIELDQEGKDTWRYAQAGAGTVALTAPNETTIMATPALDFSTILLALGAIQHPDIILVEGAREAGVRKIRLGDIELRENTIWTYDGDYENLLKKIHTEMKKE